MPDKLSELKQLFLIEGQKYNVFPLNDQLAQLALTPRPSAVAGRNVFTYTSEVSGIPTGNAPSILNRSYTITAELEIPEGGGEGMIVTEGGRFGGYGSVFTEGQAGVSLQPLEPRTVSLGRPGDTHAGQTHHCV